MAPVATCKSAGRGHLGCPSKPLKCEWPSQLATKARARGHSAGRLQMLCNRGGAIAMAVALLAIGGQPSLALRNGAPGIACINMRPLHGLHRPKPATAAHYELRQSALEWRPNDTIRVDIEALEPGGFFRGFILQAFDPTSGEQIGHFKRTDESRPVDTCAAATHRNNANKARVTLQWRAPSPNQHRGGGAGNRTSWLRPGGNIRVPLVAPVMSLSVISRRQMVGEAPPPASTLTTSPAPLAPTTLAAQTGRPAGTFGALQSFPVGPVRQVRFKATIAKSYEDFYMGYESKLADPRTFAGPIVSTLGPPLSS